MHRISLATSSLLSRMSAGPWRPPSTNPRMGRARANRRWLENMRKMIGKRNIFCALSKHLLAENIWDIRSKVGLCPTFSRGKCISMPSALEAYHIINSEQFHPDGNGATSRLANKFWLEAMLLANEAVAKSSMITDKFWYALCVVDTNSQM